MVDIAIQKALASDLLALRKAADVHAKKIEGVEQTGTARANDAVRVDVDPKIEKLASASPPTELTQDKPALTEQAAKQLALDVGENLKNANQSFAGKSERIVLGLFS